MGCTSRRLRLFPRVRGHRSRCWRFRLGTGTYLFSPALQIQLSRYAAVFLDPLLHVRTQRGLLLQLDVEATCSPHCHWLSSQLCTLQAVDSKLSGRSILEEPEPQPAQRQLVIRKRRPGSSSSDSELAGSTDATKKRMTTMQSRRRGGQHSCNTQA